MQQSPSGDEQTVRVWQEETAEAAQALEQSVSLSLGGAHDVRDLIFKAQRGIPIEPQGLLDLRDTLRRSTILTAHAWQACRAIPTPGGARQRRRRMCRAAGGDRAGHQR